MSARRRIPNVTVILQVAVALACRSPASSSPGATVKVDTVAGIEHVRNVGSPSPWSTTERLTLGSVGLDGAPESHEFGRISGLVSDHEGRIYVADGSEIRVFDPSGTLVRRFGGAGAGPGEIRSAQSIGWIGDTLAVLDPGNGRLGLFTRTGAWVGQRPYMALSGSGIRLHPVGLREIYMPFIGSVGQTVGLVFVRQTDGGASDTLIAYLDQSGSDSEWGRRGNAMRVVCTHSGGSGISSYNADLSPKSILVPAPDRLRAVAWGSEYRIAMIDAAGDTIRVIERDLPARPIADAEWVEEQRKFDEFLDTLEDESCDSRTLPRPTERRLLLGIYFDADGQMWVERDTGSGTAFDVFDHTGRLIATLDTPTRLDRVPPYVRDSRLYMVITDELDVEYVKVIDFSGRSS
jgi:hypothetical protein